MQKLLLAAASITALAVPSVVSAQVYAADPYYAPARPSIVVTPPMAQSQVYLAPGTTYVAPGTEYEDQPLYIEGRRYYRDCWWDWGRRRCELKPWW